MDENFPKTSQVSRGEFSEKVFPRNAYSKTKGEYLNLGIQFPAYDILVEHLDKVTQLETQVLIF
jgi:hypothetical protein